VLHLWPDQILVSLGAEHIEVIYRNGLNKRVLQQREVAVGNTLIKDWSSAIQQLDKVLSEIKPTEKTHLYLTLTSDLVRFIILQPQSMLVSNAEKQAYAKATYQEIYGSVSADWVIKCHPAAPQHSTVCAAIDQNLLNSIEGLAIKYKLSLKSVQPYLMSVFNRISHQLKKSNNLLAIVEFNQIVIVNISNGQFLQIRNIKISDNWQNTLEETLAREKLLGNVGSDHVMIYAPTHKNSKIHPMQGWHLKQLNIAKNKTGKARPTAMLEVLA